MIVVGSMISLGYYLPVIAAMWMRDAPRASRAGPRRGAGPGGLPALAGGSPELDEDGEPRATGGRQPEVVLVAVLAARRRSSSGSCRSRCSSSCATPARRSACCSSAAARSERLRLQQLLIGDAPDPRVAAARRSRRLGR